MRVALLHLNLSMGSEQCNLEKIASAIRLAGEGGAKWILTPEIAVQGYYFKRIHPDFAPEAQPSGKLRNILSAISAYNAILFLGCADKGTVLEPVDCLARKIGVPSDQFEILSDRKFLD